MEFILNLMQNHLLAMYPRIGESLARIGESLAYANGVAMGWPLAYILCTFGVSIAHL